MTDSIYASDPDRAPDSDFVPGELAYLVAGNAGRLLDARRTPVTVTAVSPGVGSFEVELGAFEDAGAHWELALDEVGRFQFDQTAARTDDDMLEQLRLAQAEFDRDLVVACDADVRARTESRLSRERADARAWLTRRRPATAWLDLDSLIERRHGDEELVALLTRFLNEREPDLVEIDRVFAETFVSNPRSGELVKGHAIVLAELGLRPFRGKAVRHPDLFAGLWSRERRAEHLIARLAFSSGLWSMLGIDAVTVYRGAAVDGALRPRDPGSFVSATFSSAVAHAHFSGGPTTRAALLWRGRVPVTRVLMTFLETAAMNRRFREAEAVLIDGPDVM
ncbi:MAG TPA: hypothetical protein VMU39_04000 [Solirubrobacteraceae bacterium]|nr:hypothetical protein [Solirubrobacteraceae bacterium]